MSLKYQRGLRVALIDSFLLTRRLGLSQSCHCDFIVDIISLIEASDCRCKSLSSTIHVCGTIVLAVVFPVLVAVVPCLGTTLQLEVVLPFDLVACVLLCRTRWQSCRFSGTDSPSMLSNDDIPCAEFASEVTATCGMMWLVLTI